MARHPITQLKTKYKNCGVLLENSSTITLRENDDFIWSFMTKVVKPKYRPMVQPNFDLLQSQTHQS